MTTQSTGTTPELAGKTALITGSTSGIGRATADTLAALGAHVVVSGRDTARGEAAVGEIRTAGGRADFVAADLADSAGVRTLAERALEIGGGRVDILVNNAELEAVFTARGGPPKVLRMDNGPEMISHALQQFCADRVGIVYIPPGTPWNNGFIESFNRRLRAECLNRNHWTSLLEARVVIGDFKTEHNHRHRHSALRNLTPAEYAARCSHTHRPVACDIN